MITLFNSLTNKKEAFHPITPGEVKMYVCGMTVYDFCHLGHARVLIVFDLITRWFKASGYNVTYVRNITDIDDKIIQRAKEQSISIEELTQKYIEEMNKDAKALGVINPDLEPKATESIEDMIDMIKNLIEKGFAYVGENNDVFYSVSSFEGYGKLSGKSLEDLRAGNRVEIDHAKENSFDFVLWKSAKPGEPSWKSPWGEGRPGWHIECSAMSNKFLGKNFDIHGGGQDLQFPHHENEIAQSEAHNGCKMVNYWIHNGLININKEKMSKSIGNIINIKEGLKVWDKNIFRILFLTHHYRTPVDLSNKKLEEINKSLLNLKKKLEANVSSSSNFKELWVSAMLDDFNTAKALGYYFKFINDGKLSSKSTVELEEFEETMGISGWRNDISDSMNRKSINKEEIEELIIRRNKARSDKDWSKADELRERAKELGVRLLDNDEGTTWE